jgi:hypothetical protein
MSTNLGSNVIILEEYGCSGGSFATSIEEEIRIKTNSKGNVVLSGEITMGKFLAIDRNPGLAEGAIVLPIKDIGYFVGAMLVIMAI